jgi:leucyl aminopeptidase
MDTGIQQGQIAELDALVLAMPGFDPETPRDRAVDDATGGLIGEMYNSGEFAGKLGDTALLHRPHGLRARRLMLVGAGKAAHFTPFEMRRVAGAAVRAAAAKKLQSVHFALPEGFDGPEWVQAAVEGALAGSFEPDELKSDPKKNDARVNSFTVCVAPSAAVERAAETGRIIGEAQNFARSLVNLPANILTPQELAKRAQRMAEEFGLASEILDEAAMRSLGMGALLGVSQGSENPPALIILRYTPSRAAADDRIALVGKGVTFDTGGISIKPADGMEKMKYDMGGAAAVLGAMRAIAQLRPQVAVTAYVPAVENMISGRAQRPGDIVTTMSGKTVEVLNTDAEGRLILADALTYAVRNGAATHLVDAATLTGAIAVALGHLYFGAFANNDALYSRLAAASESAGERMWRLPMDEEYKDYLKSAFADIPNIGGRWGGSITAAKFLEEFVECRPWVHLDIAGTAWLDDAKPWLAKGPTGIAVRTFVNLAMKWTG